MQLCCIEQWYTNNVRICQNCIQNRKLHWSFSSTLSRCAQSARGRICRGPICRTRGPNLPPYWRGVQFTGAQFALNQKNVISLFFQKRIDTSPGWQQWRDDHGYVGPRRSSGDLDPRLWFGIQGYPWFLFIIPICPEFFTFKTKWQNSQQNFCRRP